jgi:hypothetical protein
VTRGRAAALFVAVAVGCDKPPPEPIENSTPSPNASILPAPLAQIEQPGTESPAAAPQALRADQAPEEDSLSQRELPGVTLEAEWRYPDALPPKAPEVNVPGIEAARKATAGRMTVHLASVGRMRVMFDSRALPLAEDAEIRARSDFLGHLLVWPNGTQYRVLPPGAVRTLFGERRIDAVPLVRPQTSVKSDGPHRLGLPTKKWDLSTRTGKLSLEQARVAGAGEGGPLLCRMLTEIIAIDPLFAPCAAEDVPLRAQYAWPEGGSIAFEVVGIADKVDFSAALFFLVPPQGGQFAPTSAPPSGPGVFLTHDELAAFRLRPIEGSASRSLGAPDEGLVLHNGTDSVRYAFLDTVPVASVAPNRDQDVTGLLRGRYVVQWRTFLGDSVDPPTVVEVPARVGVGTDGGR